MCFFWVAPIIRTIIVLGSILGSTYFGKLPGRAVFNFLVTKGEWGLGLNNGFGCGLFGEVEGGKMDPSIGSTCILEAYVGIVIGIHFPTFP